MKLTRYERETIVNFNEAEDIAYIYTCSKAWINHFERVLGLRPSVIHSYAREYEVPKAWVRKPLKPRKLSEEQKLKLSRLLISIRAKLYVLSYDILETGGVGQAVTLTFISRFAL